MSNTTADWAGAPQNASPDGEFVRDTNYITDRIVDLAERYEDTLPALSALVDDYEAKVRSHLERMGFKW